MAITKISQYNSSPTDETDYQAQNEHLQAFINQLNSGAFILSQASTTSVPYLQQGVYIQMGGTVYIVDTEDYTIQSIPATNSTNYISLSISGDNLIATWVSDISSYSWNNVYNYMSNGTNILLPYSVYYDGTYYLMGGLNKVFNQNLNTYNNVSFANINPPIDNNDTSIPNIGVGGFTYSYINAEDNTTLPAGGAYILIISSLSQMQGNPVIGRYPGGSVFRNSGSVPAHLLIWRIS